MRRGRGLKKAGQGRPPQLPKTPMSKATTSSLVFKVTERDNDIVTCSLCPHTSTFSEFRLHNISQHYNIGTTTDDTTVIDHKFYVKKLQEMAKLLKLTSFICPGPTCTSKYKSALGLAYHLETCGKTQEQVEACLVECDICHAKFTVPNLNWHKKTQHRPPVVIYVDVDGQPAAEPEPSTSTGKRKSALKAREIMKEISDFTTSTASDEAGLRRSAQANRDSRDEDFILPTNIKREYDEDWQDQHWVSEPRVDCLLGFGDIKEDPDSESSRGISSMVPISANRLDFTTQAYKYLEAHPQNAKESAWDTPTRNFVDPFPADRLPCENQLEQMSSDEEIRSYLPTTELSCEFRTKVQVSPVGATTGNTDSAFLISDYHRLPWFQTEEMDTGGPLHTPNIISYTGGPVSAMAWHPSGKFLAVSTLQDYEQNEGLGEAASRPTSIQIYKEPDFRLELIVAFDASFINHMQWASYWPTACDSQFNITDDPIPDEQYRIGYLATACMDSTVRIMTIRREHFELPPTFSRLPDSQIRVYRKVPEVTLCLDESSKHSPGHCTRFDWHEENRFLVAGYSSGLVAVFDLQTTSRLLNKHDADVDGKGSSVRTYFPFWLINNHLAGITGINFDPTNPRYFHTGSADRMLKTWDVDLRIEIDSKKVGLIMETCWIRGWMHVACSIDFAVSNMGAQYNFVRFYQLGNSKGISNQVEYFNVTGLSFLDGMTLSGTENGRVSVTYYDSFWRECDYDRNKKKKNVVNISRVLLDPTSYEHTKYIKHESELEPLPVGDPRIDIVVMKKDRTNSSWHTEPEPDDVENLYRFYKFLRVNKVGWCPTGKHLAVGYRNGLLTILPANYKSLYET